MVDVREREGDFLVDPERLSVLAEAYGRNARLVRVQGQPAVRLLFERGESAIVMYVIATSSHDDERFHRYARDLGGVCTPKADAGSDAERDRGLDR